MLVGCMVVGVGLVLMLFNGGLVWVIEDLVLGLFEFSVFGLVLVVFENGWFM